MPRVKLRDPERCPKCEVAGQVIDSRRRRGYRRRVYQCGKCWLKWEAFLSTVNPKRLIEMPRDQKRLSE